MATELAENSFTAFDSAMKISEAIATDATGSQLRIAKGAFASVIGLALSSAAAAAKELEGKGFRVLAVAAGPRPR